MAGDVFTIRVLTPAGLLFEDRTASVTVPIANGEIGVLTMHQRYVGALGTGVLLYNQAESEEQRRLVVSGGFCEFADEVLTILADTVDLPETVDAKGYASQRGELEKIVSSSDTQQLEWQYAKKKLDRIEAIEKLLGMAAH